MLRKILRIVAYTPEVVLAILCGAVLFLYFRDWSADELLGFARVRSLNCTFFKLFIGSEGAVAFSYNSIKLDPSEKRSTSDGISWTHDRFTPSVTASGPDPNLKLHVGRLGLGYGFWDGSEMIFVTAPTWMAIIALAGLPIYRLIRQRRVRRIPGTCRRCGYDLRMTPDRCPECGVSPKVPFRPA